MIKLVTDYHANLPSDIIKKYDISIIPSYVSFGDEKLLEGVDFTSTEFFERLEKSEELPVTAPAPQEEYDEFYKKLIDKNPEANILTIHFSGEMSEMYNYSVEAVKEVEDTEIEVFDSRSASIAEGLMVHQAAKMIEQEKPLPEIVKTLEHMRDTARIFFIIDTLKYLSKGGRIGKASYLIGEALSTKPVLTIHEGKVTGYARFRDRGAANKNLIGLAMHVARGVENVQFGIVHAACPVEAEELAENLRKEIESPDIIIGELSPAIGAHSGPKALGLAWYVPADSA